MIRVVVEALLLFLTPFAAFALYLAVRRRNPVATDAWTRGALGTLSVAGLGFAAFAILVFGLFEDRPMGAYVPAHVEDGRLVPGRFQ